jgi:acyl-CoA synthetase (NDP forming)
MLAERQSERQGSLEALFAPRAIALVGVSGNPDSPYARPLEYLRAIGFDGAVYPVNPRYEELAGFRCYPSLRDIPGPVDLVMVLVAAAHAVEVVREAAAAGAGAVVICSSGFSEMGPEGRARERELLQVAREHGVRVVGPNSQGLFYLGSSLAATFTGAAAIGFPTSGGAAYVGQSGAVGGVVLDVARESGMGLSGWVSTGNDLDVTAQEAAAHLIEKDDVRVLMLYVEAIPDGASYTALAQRAHELGKHLVVLRSGRSDAGRRAIASHTGAMVPTDRAFDLVSAQAGVVLVDDVDEMVRVGHALLALPVPERNRVVIVTTSGGAGGLAADACAREGLVVEPLDADVRDSLVGLLPEFAALGNPVDVTVQLLTQDGDGFAEVCRIVASAPSTDAVLVLVTSPMGALGERLAKQVIDVTTTSDTPVLTAWMAGREQTAAGRAMFRSAGIPLFDGPDQVARVLARLASRAVAPGQDDEHSVGQPPPVVLPPLPAKPLIIEADGLPLLDAVGIPRPRAQLVRTPEALEQAIRDLGGTAVVKIQSPRVLHKTDVGGVRIGVTTAEAPEVFQQLTALIDGDPEALGLLVQEMVEVGVELVLGVTSSPAGFPHIMTVGFGGIATEIYADVASVLLPVDHESARRALLSLRAAPLLTGYRGRPPLDLEAAVDAVVALGSLATALGPDFAEVEVNPMMVRQDGVCAVDFLLHMSTEDVQHG